MRSLDSQPRRHGGGLGRRDGGIKGGTMGNMSYCRFENTAKDLQDCYDNMDGTNLSDTEREARKRLIEICVDVAINYGGDIDRPCEEI